MDPKDSLATLDSRIMHFFTGASLTAGSNSTSSDPEGVSSVSTTRTLGNQTDAAMPPSPPSDRKASPGNQEEIKSKEILPPKRDRSSIPFPLARTASAARTRMILHALGGAPLAGGPIPPSNWNQKAPTNNPPSTSASPSLPRYTAREERLPGTKEKSKEGGKGPAFSKEEESTMESRARAREPMTQQLLDSMYGNISFDVDRSPISSPAGQDDQDDSTREKDRHGKEKKHKKWPKERKNKLKKERKRSEKAPNIENVLELSEKLAKVQKWSDGRKRDKKIAKLKKKMLKALLHDDSKEEGCVSSDSEASRRFRSASRDCNYDNRISEWPKSGDNHPFTRSRRPWREDTQPFRSGLPKDDRGSGPTDTNDEEEDHYTKHHKPYHNETLTESTHKVPRGSGTTHAKSTFAPTQQDEEYAGEKDWSRKEESEGKMYLELRFMTSIPPVTTSRQGTSSPTRPSFSPLLSTKSRSKSPSIESQGLSAERMFKASRSRSRSRSSPYEPKKRSHSSSSGASHRKTSGLSPPFQRRRRSSSSESDRPSRSPSPWQERRGRACSPFQERGRPRRSISNSPKHDRLPHNPSGRALSDLSPLSARAQKEVQLKNDEDSYWERRGNKNSLKRVKKRQAKFLPKAQRLTFLAEQNRRSIYGPSKPTPQPEDNGW